MFIFDKIEIYLRSRRNAWLLAKLYLEFNPTQRTQLVRFAETLGGKGHEYKST